MGIKKRLRTCLCFIHTLLFSQNENPDEQILQCWMSSDGSERLHNLHINPFCLMIVHATQNFFTSSNLDMFPLAKDAAISMISGWTSFTFSILTTLPRTSRVYLLTAVWVIPNRLATSFCFKPYVCINCFAIAHRMAGTTDFTATSQGTNIVSFTEQFIVVEKYLSMTYVIYNMTYVLKSDERDATHHILSLLSFPSFSRASDDLELLYDIRH